MRYQNLFFLCINKIKYLAQRNVDSTLVVARPESTVSPAAPKCSGSPLGLPVRAASSLSAATPPRTWCHQLPSHARVRLDNGRHLRMVSPHVF